jgi:hypothetical protein
MLTAVEIRGFSVLQMQPTAYTIITSDAYMPRFEALSGISVASEVHMREASTFYGILDIWHENTPNLQHLYE